MGLDGLSLNSYWRVGYWEGENGVAYWCMPLLHFLFSHSLFFPSLSIFSFWFLCYLFSFLSFFFFFLFFFFCFFSFSLFLTYFSLLSLVLAPPFPHCAQPMPFYTVCCDGFYCFTPQLLLFGCGCLSQATHWFVSYPTITTSLRWPCHVPFPEKRVFFCFLALRGIPIWIRVRHSL